MKVPLNWLKEYVELPKDTMALTDKLTMIGHMLDKKEVLNGRTVIDLELRGNRADCYSIIGIARETAASFNKKLMLPKTHKELRPVKSHKEVVLSPDPKYVARVMTAIVRNVKITKSPKWLSQALEEYGVPSINNIVDLTNYVMIETGQPMHAFDLKRVEGKLEIRLAKKGEKMRTIHGNEIVLGSEDLVWANETEILSIAGAIGGKKHSISENTKDIYLEAANYDRANIRRSIHTLNLFTDAGIRHEKELDPNLVSFGIYRFLGLIEENKWGDIDAEVTDYYPKQVKPWMVSLNYKHLNNLTGIYFKESEVKKILSSLGFEIKKESQEGIEVLVPTHRTDVKLAEDLIEEVVRVHGYEKIPADILSLEIPEEITPNYIIQERDLKEALTALSFNEVISLPFVNKKSLKNNFYLGGDSAIEIKVLNRPSHDLEYLRLSLWPNLCEAVGKITNERGEVAHLFEIGKIYYKSGKNYKEERKVGIAYWEKGGSFSDFKSYLEGFFEKADLKNITVKPKDIKEFSNTYSINLSGQIVGIGGQKGDIYYAEIDLEKILGKRKGASISLWPQYPPQIEDITINIPEGKIVGDVVQSIKEVDDIVRSVELVDVYNRNFTFRISYQDPKKTLSSKEVEKVREKITRSVGI